jgi:hypothetical protein
VVMTTTLTDQVRSRRAHRRVPVIVSPRVAAADDDRAALRGRLRCLRRGGYTRPIGGGTRGSKRPGVVILQRLAKALGAPVTALLE